MAATPAGEHAVAEIDPWDTHLEAVTARLDELTAGTVRGRVALVQPGGWTLDCRGAGRAITFQFGHPAGPEAMPGDYGRAVIYGCSYSPLGNEGRPSGFGKTLSVREGFRWDEESIREQVLEAIGILRYVLGVSDPASVEFQDHTRQGPVAAARATVQRRKKR
jgi:hypothetical protein